MENKENTFSVGDSSVLHTDPLALYRYGAHRYHSSEEQCPPEVTLSGDTAATVRRLSPALIHKLHFRSCCH